MTDDWEPRVREHLQPGEPFRAAVWVSRADGRAPVQVTRAEMSPFRFRKATPEVRSAVRGAPTSRAAGLDEHMRTVTNPRVLALTDRRLLVLAKRSRPWRERLKPVAPGLPPLRLRWECPRTDLASATEEAGRLSLTFTDGSAVTLLTPTAHVQPFLAG